METGEKERFVWKCLWNKTFMAHELQAALVLPKTFCCKKRE